MTFEDRVAALAPLGFTPRQTRFLAMVALHGGYCLGRQYCAFAGIRKGKNASDFLESLVAKQLARRFSIRTDRGHLYHLQARAIYRAVGEEDNRNRREASAAVIARKIMLLDYVLAHPHIEWLATEHDKVALFAEQHRVPLTDLPQRVFRSSTPGVADTTRFFLDKLPVGVDRTPSVCYFICLMTDGTGRALHQFLAEHARLFRWLSAWVVIALGPSAEAVAMCPGVFARRSEPRLEPSTLTLEDLRWCFATRQIIDQGAWARLSVAEIDRFRTLRDSFRTATFDALYAEWTTQGDAALAPYRPTAARAPARHAGQLVTEVLPFDYSQFGSLPGIA